MTGPAIRGDALAARLIALNALFEAARAGEARHEDARFVAFCDGVSHELARCQIEEVMDALCIAPLAADLDAAIRSLGA